MCSTRTALIAEELAAVEHQAVVTIVDVLSGRVRVTAPLKITPAQQLYYNYRFHQPSFECEIHERGKSSPHREFRSLCERGPDE